MNPTVQALSGALLAIGILGCGLLGAIGPYLLSAPLFFLFPLCLQYPRSGPWFLGVFTFGLLAGHFFLGVYPLPGILFEPLALVLLAFIPYSFRETERDTNTRLGKMEGEKREELARYQGSAEKVRKENQQNEKKLRQVEHLYDVIKEAGGTLNVQEMIELAREFTERMFDLEHFILAVLSEDGKKYEVRAVSGCDESAFRNFEMGTDEGRLIPVLSREKRALYVPSIPEGSPYALFKNLTVRSFLLLPFMVQDRVIGFLCSFSGQEGLLDQEKLSNLQVFGNQISIGLQKSLLYEKVQKLSITDGLTKLFSHRHFRERLQEEIVLAGRYSSPLTLLMLDIDHFKHYNDTYGHVAGDHVLQEVAKTLRDRSELTHLAARYGGEEMVLVAPETTKDQGMELAEKIRAAVENKKIAIGKEVTQVTTSIGIATYPQDAQNVLDLIAKADQALYAAKGRGRNRVVAYPP